MPSPSTTLGRVSNASYRLSESIRPTRYRLSLAPDIAAATFTGTVEIDVQLAEATSEIRLNAVDLEISSAVVQTPGGQLAASATFDPENEMVALDLDSPVGPGQATLRIAFTGILNDLLAGFYRSNFKDDNGNTVWIATTQFESTDARRAFPCFDEPAMKAVFEIELIVDANHLAVSNGAEVSSEMIGDGRKRVRFEPTMAMSTYLVAFVVGPLVATEPRMVGNTPLRVIHRPGWEKLTTFALDCGAHALEFLQDFFSIPYPASKLDLIAIPDFAFGAMENLGAVTFRESALLVDAQASSQPERERIVDVVSHEIAHMWFGDLVTMKWWNGIWLNEAFATYMETLTTDHFEPDWRKWNSFGIFRAAAQATDSLHSTRPIEYAVARPADCAAMFDVLTYEKGGSVLRMLERYLGTDRMRQGISHYLDKYRYSNTETTDLWDALEEVTGEPVRALMDTWVFQGGLPVVEVTVRGEEIWARQEPFSFLPQRPADSAIGQSWMVPLAVRKLHDYDNVRQLLLTGPEQAIGSLSDGVPVVNAHGPGYYRVAYSEELLNRLLDSFSHLDELERFNLVSDYWAMVVAGRAPFAGFLSIASAFSAGAYPEVAGWTTVIGGLRAAATALGPGADAELTSTARRLIQPMLVKLGLSPEPGEPETNGVLRSRIIGTLGTLVRDREIIEMAREAFRAEMSKEGPLEPSLAVAILDTVAANGDEADYAFVLDRFRHPESPIDEQRFLSTLASFEIPALVNRTLPMTLDGIRSQDAPFVIARMLANPATQALTFDYMVSNFERMVEIYPGSTIVRMLEGVTALYSPVMLESAERVRGFLATAQVPEAGKRVAQITERYEANLALAKRLTADLA